MSELLIRDNFVVSFYKEYADLSKELRNDDHLALYVYQLTKLAGRERCWGGRSAGLLCLCYCLRTVIAIKIRPVLYAKLILVDLG